MVRIFTIVRTANASLSMEVERGLPRAPGTVLPPNEVVKLRPRATASGPRGGSQARRTHRLSSRYYPAPRQPTRQDLLRRRPPLQGLGPVGPLPEGRIR